MLLQQIQRQFCFVFPLASSIMFMISSAEANCGYFPIAIIAIEAYFFFLFSVGCYFFLQARTPSLAHVIYGKTDVRID